MKIASSHTVLVTGVSGTLGWNLSRRLAGRCRVVGTFCSHKVAPSSVEAIGLDLRNIDRVADAIRSIKPHIIIHLAALTHPDVCEENPQVAFAINRDGTREIALAAETLGAKLVFASTDLVFDGSKGNYCEDDEAHPLSVYGKSKLEAERALLDICPDAFVFRTSLIYGFGSPVSGTFLTALLQRLGKGESMKVFTDQKRSPILVDDLARAIVLALEKDLTGRYHIAGSEVLTRYEFARLVCEAFGLDETLLVPIKMAEFDYVAKRPLDSSLDGTRFRHVSGFTPTPTVSALGRLAENYRNQKWK